MPAGRNAVSNRDVYSVWNEEGRLGALSNGRQSTILPAFHLMAQLHRVSGNETRRIEEAASLDNRSPGIYAD